MAKIYLASFKKMSRTKLTPEQLEEIKRDYHNTQSSELAERYGCSIYAIYNAAHRYGLKKDIEFIRELARKKMLDPNHPGRKHLIKKGSIPPNKGKKQAEYMSPEAIERTKHTRFQKGHLPHNTRHDFAFSDRRSKGKVYRWIRVGLSKWVLYQRYVWDQAYGSIPKGFNVQFKDGNTLNFELDNLYLISRADQLKNENSLHARYPEEIRKLIQLKGALNRQINKATIKNGSNGSN